MDIFTELRSFDVSQVINLQSYENESAIFDSYSRFDSKKMVTSHVIFVSLFSGSFMTESSRETFFGENEQKVNWHTLLLVTSQNQSCFSQKVGT